MGRETKGRPNHGGGTSGGRGTRDNRLAASYEYLSGRKTLRRRRVFMFRFIVLLLFLVMTVFFFFMRMHELYNAIVIKTTEGASCPAQCLESRTDRCPSIACTGIV